jgi:hypothetical protein
MRGRHERPNHEGQYYCPGCNQWLDRDRFYSFANRPRAVFPTCKVCTLKRLEQEYLNKRTQEDMDGLQKFTNESWVIEEIIKTTDDKINIKYRSLLGSGAIRFSPGGFKRTGLYLRWKEKNYKVYWHFGELKTKEIQ